MKRLLYLFSIAVALCLSNISKAQTLNGNINLTSQEEVDAFNYTVVTGELRIYDDSGDGSPITNLNGLSELTRVNYRINISNCDSLTSLDGLENVTRADYVYIQNNNSLTKISGFLALIDNDHCVIIKKNIRLKDIKGFNSLKSTNGYIHIQDCDSLRAITGFTSMEKVNYDLSIWNCPLLTDISGFSNLIQVHSLSVGYNDSLNLSGFSAFCSLFNGDTQPTDINITNNADNPTPEEIVASCRTSSVPLINEQEIDIYPNPAYNNITINCSQFIEAAIYTFAGALMITSNKPVVEVQNLQSGLYMVKIKSDQGYFVSKFLKQ